jgi:general secretion pathway protein D
MTIAIIRSLWLAAFLGAMVATAHAQAPAQPAPAPQAAPPAAAAPPAQPAPPAPPPPAVLPGLPTVPLQPLLDRVARESKKQFLLDGRVSPEIYLAGVRQEDVTYPILLSILRANGFASVEIEGRVNVIPDFNVRFFATPIVQNDDNRIAADAWVTRLVTTTNVDAAMLVPILRPLLPQAAHLAALPPNSLIMMDRYANVQRITAIVKSLDQPGAGHPRKE